VAAAAAVPAATGQRPTPIDLFDIPAAADAGRSTPLPLFASRADSQAVIQPPQHSSFTSAASRPELSSRSQRPADHAARSACHPADAQNAAFGDGRPSVTASAAATTPDAERTAPPCYNRSGKEETGSRRRSSRGGSSVVPRDVGRSGEEECRPATVASAPSTTARHPTSDATASTSASTAASLTPPPRTSRRPGGRLRRRATRWWPPLPSSLSAGGRNGGGGPCGHRGSGGGGVPTTEGGGRRDRRRPRVVGARGAARLRRAERGGRQPRCGQLGGREE